MSIFVQESKKEVIIKNISSTKVCLISLLWVIIITSLQYFYLGGWEYIFLKPQLVISVKDSQNLEKIFKDPDKLIKKLQLNTIKNPKDALAWQWLAKIYAVQGKNSLAIEAAKKSLDIKKKLY